MGANINQDGKDRLPKTYIVILKGSKQDEEKLEKVLQDQEGVIEIKKLLPLNHF